MSDPVHLAVIKGGALVAVAVARATRLTPVVLDIAYVQNEILSEEAFTTLMATCLVLNICVPLTIHAWKPFFVRAEERRLASRRH